MCIENQIRTIIGCGIEVYNTLGFGFFESVYHKALIIELENKGIKTESECPLPVYYKGGLVGNFYADIIAENQIVIELKSVISINSVHETQLVNYLAATKIDTGLILNFNESKVQIKRKYRKYRPKLTYGKKLYP